MKLIIATNNKGKVKEYKELLEPLGYEAVSLKDEGIEADIAEDGNTFEENARIKARAIFNMTGMPVIADDSGLEVDYLNGEPGVFSARYGGGGLSDSERYELVLEKLKGVPKSKRGARFVCAVCYIKDNETEYLVKGTVDGFIGEKPVGENGFGYDPIFMLNDGVSMAMLSEAEKNKISHRGNAINNLIKDLRG